MGYENSGRRPQPTALTVLRGNPSKKKLNKNEPHPPCGEVMKPSTLSPGASIVWDALAPVCLAMGTLTVADTKVFARMCELEATWDANTARKGTEGFNPRQELDTARELRPYSALFGLEPVSRARIQVPKKTNEPDSKWAGALL
jgi:phage terminase small subunit